MATDKRKGASPEKGGGTSPPGGDRPADPLKAAVSELLKVIASLPAEKQEQIRTQINIIRKLTGLRFEDEDGRHWPWFPIW